MKTNKYTNITIDLVKLLKENGVTLRTACINVIIRDGIPQISRVSTITPIYKQKGDPSECGNYLVIKLLGHHLKLLEWAVKARLQESLIKKNKYGFQKARRTIKPMFCLRILQEKSKKYKKDLHIFVDWEKTCDTIQWDLMWYCPLWENRRDSNRNWSTPKIYIELIVFYYNHGYNNRGYHQRYAKGNVTCR